MWHMTYDMWRMTCDMWHLMWVEHSLKMLALPVLDLWDSEDLEEKDDWLKYWRNEWRGCFFRKASATPGLLTNTGLTLSSMEYNVFFLGWLTLGPNQSFMVLPIKPLLVSPRVIMALPLSGSQLLAPGTHWNSHLLLARQQLQSGNNLTFP